MSLKSCKMRWRLLKSRRPNVTIDAYPCHRHELSQTGQLKSLEHCTQHPESYVMVFTWRFIEAPQ